MKKKFEDYLDDQIGIIKQLIEQTDDEVFAGKLVILWIKKQAI